MITPIEDAYHNELKPIRQGYQTIEYDFLEHYGEKISDDLFIDLVSKLWLRPFADASRQGWNQSADLFVSSLCVYIGTCSFCCRTGCANL